MDSLKYIAAGFFLGLGLAYFMQGFYEPPPQINYIDQEMHDDQDIDKVILVQIPQE